MSTRTEALIIAMFGHLDGDGGQIKFLIASKFMEVFGMKSMPTPVTIVGRVRFDEIRMATLTECPPRMARLRP